MGKRLMRVAAENDNLIYYASAENGKHVMHIYVQDDDILEAAIKIQIERDLHDKRAK